MSVSHCYELMHQLFKIFVPYAYSLVLQVSIARVHPISATTSYKTTLKKVDFTEEEHGETLCGTCGLNYAGEASEFSICCDNCDKWFHGKCVKITPARVEGIKRYKCPSWSSKRARPWQWPWWWRLCIPGYYVTAILFTSSGY